MDGLGILLRAMGVEIDPVEVAKAVSDAKVLIPVIAQKFAEISASQQRIEAKLDKLILELAPLTDVDTNEEPARELAVIV